MAFRHPKLDISFGEVMAAVGGEEGSAWFPEGASSFPLGVFQGDGERWRQLGGKNLSILILYCPLQSLESKPGRGVESLTLCEMLLHCILFCMQLSTQQQHTLFN